MLSIATGDSAAIAPKIRPQTEPIRTEETLTANAERVETNTLENISRPK